MKKLSLLILLALLSLACQLVSSPAIALAAITPSPSEPDGVKKIQNTPALTGYTRVRLHPADGSLMEQVKSEAQKAAIQGQKLFLEFDASW